jgi:N-formylmaleamate deformylase
MGLTNEPYEQTYPGNGIEIHVCQMGNTENPPVLMIHGIYDEWKSWQLVVDEFVKEYRLILVDLRGHGRSAKPERGYEPTDYAADMAAVIRALDLESVSVVGHSLGAVTAAYLAAGYPELVRAVVLEDPPGQLGTGSGSRMAPILEAKRGTEEETYTFFRENNPHFGEGRWRDQTRRLRNTADGPFEIILEWAETGEGPDVVGTMKHVECPALLMQADPASGGVLPDAVAEQIVANLPNGELQSFPGVGRNIHKDSPQAFVRAAMNFLRQFR